MEFGAVDETVSSPADLIPILAPCAFNIRVKDLYSQSMAPVTYGPLDEEQATSAAIVSTMKKLEAVDCLVGRARRGVQFAEEDVRAAKDAVTEAQRVLLLAQHHSEACKNAFDSAREDLSAAQYLRAGLLGAVHHDRSVLSDLLLLSTQYLKTTATVTRLPSDILHCIFDFIGDPGPQHSRWNRGIVLSHVCRHWRYVALSTPFLWTTIDFRYGSYFARLFARRSRDYPLHIVIQPLPEDPTVDPAAYNKVENTFLVRHLRAFVVAVLEHAERWSSFTLSAHHARIPSLVLGWISKSFDSRQLKGITLDKASLSGPELCYTIIQELNKQYPYSSGVVEQGPFSARRLVIQRLTLAHLGFFSSAVVSLELRDLLHRHFGLFPMLERCPNLRELVVILDEPFDQENAAQHICTFPRLRDLTLSDSLCLQFMRMPSLNKLHIYHTSSCSITLAQLGVLVGDSPVVELFISYKTLPYAYQPSLPGFRHDSRPLFPFLRSLSLDHTFIENEDLLSTAEFPNLLKLRLHMEKFVTLAWLQQILQKRASNESITSLERLEVVLCSEIMDDDRYVLEKQVTELVLFADDDPTDDDYDPELDLKSESDTDSEIDAVIDDSEVEYLQAVDRKHGLSRPYNR